ncbi:tyrosine-type recombinase/integrase [Leucobacter chinensis]|uniref:tyrosine-type recombinase/integrase n=1 Tax=Leucobacter chinensis TaxID=2851010 RepID=UPI001C24E71A|nr:site-specific integrase [Leucobacter chinensis]
MGSIYPYETSKGEKRYRIVFRDANNQQSSKRGFTGLREAQRALNKLETSIHEGSYTPAAAGRVAINDLANDWIETKKATLKPSSYTALEASWRNHVAPKWGETQVSKIKPASVQKWINSLDKSPSVIRRAHEVLAGIIDTAIPTHLKTNPARGTALPKKVKASERRYLTHKELWRLAEAAGDRKTLILTLGYCGIRWGEATALQKQDLDTAQQRLHVRRNVVLIGSTHTPGTPKSHNNRRVPVPTLVWQLLEQQVAGLPRTGLVFDNGYGGYMNPPSGGKTGRNWWVSALKTAGIDYLTIHDLRHTAASLAVSSGAHVKVIQRMLGHASASITLDVYADLFEDDLGLLVERLDQAIDEQIVAKSVATAASEE